ncbi:MAG TPA: hypothetical protein VKR52_07705 [Terracidiphilus sp.]|nr:hypothetical protein [Terracidiphilus sp.]
MRKNRSYLALAMLGCLCATLYATALEPLRSTCRITASENVNRFSIRLGSDDCGDQDRCGSSFTSDTLSQLTGITLADLDREGAHLTATLNAEAGTFTCEGTVHNTALDGESVFTPSKEFVSKMEQMGFSGFDVEKLRTFALLDVESGWAHSLQQAGIQGITTENLIALRIFKVTPEYAHSFAELGYDLPNAEQLISMRVQGVDPEEVRQIRALGYKPTLEELVQIRIFKITPDFIQRMQARGFKNLTIAKLVQIRIFKLAD